MCEPVTAALIGSALATAGGVGTALLTDAPSLPTPAPPITQSGVSTVADVRVGSDVKDQRTTTTDLQSASSPVSLGGSLGLNV